MMVQDATRASGLVHREGPLDLDLSKRGPASPDEMEHEDSAPAIDGGLEGVEPHELEVRDEEEDMVHTTALNQELVGVE